MNATAIAVGGVWLLIPAAVATPIDPSGPSGPGSGAHAPGSGVPGGWISTRSEGVVSLPELNGAARRMLTVELAEHALRGGGGEEFSLVQFGEADAFRGMAVQVLGGSGAGWSAWRYECADLYEPLPEGSGRFMTGFDLARFGIGPDDEVRAVRVVALRPGDVVTDQAGEGYVLFGGVLAGWEPSPGLFDGPEFMVGAVDFDAVGIHLRMTPIPLPSPLGLGAAGLALLLLGARRRP